MGPDAASGQAGRRALRRGQRPFCRAPHPNRLRARHGARPARRYTGFDLWGDPRPPKCAGRHAPRTDAGGLAGSASTRRFLSSRRSSSADLSRALAPRSSLRAARRARLACLCADQRVRAASAPDRWDRRRHRLRQRDRHSFPSGHVLNFVIFLGFLSYLIYTLLPTTPATHHTPRVPHRADRLSRTVADLPGAALVHRYARLRPARHHDLDRRADSSIALAKARQVRATTEARRCPRADNRHMPGRAILRQNIGASRWMRWGRRREKDRWPQQHR